MLTNALGGLFMVSLAWMILCSSARLIDRWNKLRSDADLRVLAVFDHVPTPFFLFGVLGVVIVIFASTAVRTRLETVVPEN